MHLETEMIWYDVYGDGVDSLFGEKGQQHILVSI